MWGVFPSGRSSGPRKPHGEAGRSHVPGQLHVAVAGVLAFVLLTLTPGWLPLLRWVVRGATVALAVLASRIRMTPQQRWHWVVAAGPVAVIPPTAYSVATVAAQHAGDSPVVGPRHVNSPVGVVPASDPGLSPSWLLARLEEQPAVVQDFRTPWTGLGSTGPESRSTRVGLWRSSW